MSIDINSKFPGYIPFQLVQGKVLKLDFMEVQLKVYDMVTVLCTPKIADALSLSEISGFHVESVEGLNDVIENGNVFSLSPSTDSIGDIPLLLLDNLI